MGPSARLELEREDDKSIVDAEIPSELYRGLGLREGETLLLRPRKTKVLLRAALAELMQKLDNPYRER